MARKGLTDREVKRGAGGIRDIEFAVQLLQLVHGRLDPELRSPTTLDALAELARRGYVDRDDADQLADGLPVPAAARAPAPARRTSSRCTPCPADEAERTRIARTLGFRDASSGDRA